MILLKNSLVPASSQSITTRTHCASIHSTPVACEKRKSKRVDVSLNSFSSFSCGFMREMFRFFYESIFGVFLFVFVIQFKVMID